MITFGPVPSRRLGRSLGINNIPPHHCSYSCVYCQLGRTNVLETARKEFFPADDVVADVQRKINTLRSTGERIDFLTFVPDGEPTLDIHLGEEIIAVKSFGIPVAVITNASLLHRPDVREELMSADLVSVKIDSAVGRIWKSVDRPHGSLDCRKIFDGISRFRAAYTGVLMTETMLVQEINDSAASIGETADMISHLGPQKAFLLIPTRPPAESFVSAPDTAVLTAAHQAFASRGITVELLAHPEEDDFTYESDAAKELMEILSVHPMRIEAVKKFLFLSNSGWDVIEKLQHDNRVEEIVYEHHSFIVRTFVNGPHR